MNIFVDIRAVTLAALDTLCAEGVIPPGLEFEKVTVEPPRDPAHGDMATNAAMVIAKAAQKKPREIAAALRQILLQDDRIVRAEVAGPGFLNLHLAPQVWHSLIAEILKQGAAYGQSDTGAGQTVNIEYVSANPTGPLHVGHTRGAVFGDSLAALLAFVGFDVTREYYINDGGAQVETLARSVYLRYLEAHGRDIDFAEGTYPGDYLKPVGAALKAKVGAAYLDQPEDIWLFEVRDFAIAAMMALIRADLAALGIAMDVFFSEASLYGTGRIEAAIETLKDKGLIYWGQLPPPKGKLPADWQARAQWLFRSTAYGDDEDRPVQKADGTWAYFAPDIAYHYDKITRGADALIDVLGADHGGYVKRMQAAVAALSDGQVLLDVRLAQIVKLYKNGVEFKMSKRAGTFITVQDLLAEVGRDVVRFMMLTRKNDAPLDFDFDKAVEQSKDNPVYYVQYAHARVKSVLRHALKAGYSVADADLCGADLTHLDHPAEHKLCAKLAEWPRLVDIAARTHEPHRIAFYLYDLASDFHAHWNAGNETPGLRFLQDGQEGVTQAKIALARAVAVVISTGLGILGVKPIEEMR